MRWEEEATQREKTIHMSHHTNGPALGWEGKREERGGEEKKGGQEPREEGCMKCRPRQSNSQWSHTPRDSSSPVLESFPLLCFPFLSIPLVFSFSFISYPFHCIYFSLLGPFLFFALISSVFTFHFFCLLLSSLSRSPLYFLVRSSGWMVCLTKNRFTLYCNACGTVHKENWVWCFIFRQQRYCSCSIGGMLPQEYCLTKLTLAKIKMTDERSQKTIYLIIFNYKCASNMSYICGLTEILLYSRAGKDSNVY